MIKDYFILAFQNLKHRGLRSILTMLGIFIGIAAVVALISLGQGLQEAITGQFASLSVDRLLIQNVGTGFGPPGSTSVEKLHEHDIKVIESVPGIKIIVASVCPIEEQKRLIPFADDYYDKSEGTLKLLEKVTSAFANKDR